MGWGDLPQDRAAIVRCAVARVLRRQATVCADDLHAELSAQEFPWDRRGFGAVLVRLQREGRLQAIGYKPSKRGHARPIVEFRAVVR